MTSIPPLPDAKAQMTGPIAAWIGLDWADQQHVISLYDVASGQTRQTTPVLEEAYAADQPANGSAFGSHRASTSIDGRPGGGGSLCTDGPGASGPTGTTAEGHRAVRASDRRALSASPRSQPI